MRTLATIVLGIVLAAQASAAPLHRAYEITTTSSEPTGETMQRLVETAAKDAVFWKDWKDALSLAATIVKDIDALPPVTLAPASAPKLAAKGLQVTTVSDLERGTMQEDAVRLPMLGTAAALFVDQMRIKDTKDTQKPTDFELSNARCGADRAWVARNKDGVQAIAFGRCAKLAGLEGPYIARTVELLVYDPTGKLVLVVGHGHLEAYRWSTEAGKPMLAGGRSLLMFGKTVEATTSP